MSTEYCIILTACDSKECCDKIIKELFDRKLVSCVQTNNINSTYIWKGKLTNTNEIILNIKSKKLLYKEIEKCIIENHTYETPEIIQIPIENGYEGFLSWITEVTK